MRSESVTVTENIGSIVASFCVPSDVLILSGDLGAGKTAFSRGFGCGLGALDPVTSPTFTIMREHELRDGGLFLHLDAYRLNGASDVDDIGLTELLDRGAVAVIEWGERIVGALGNDYLLLRFTHGDQNEGDDVRFVSLEANGDRWTSALVDLRSALQSWAVTVDQVEGSR